MIVIFRRHIIKVIHDRIRTPETMAARHRRNTRASNHGINEDTHEIPFSAPEVRKKLHISIMRIEPL